MKKLDANGIAHFLIPLLAVVIVVAAVGTYMIVGSHAASNRPHIAKVGTVKVGRVMTYTIRITGTEANSVRVHIGNYEATSTGNNKFSIFVPENGSSGASVERSQKVSVCYKFDKKDPDNCKRDVYAFPTFKRT